MKQNAAFNICLRFVLSSVVFLFIINTASSQEEISAATKQKLLQEYKKIKTPEISLEAFTKINAHIYDRKPVVGAAGRTLRVGDCNVIHSVCGNGDFESGAIDMTQWNGGFGITTGGQPNPYLMTDGFSSGALTSSAARQTVVGTGIDPTVGIPTVSPSGGNYALRIGNRVNGRGAEFISKTITVSAGQTIFPFQYAVVFEDPGHAPSEQPAFSVRVFDCNRNEITGVVNLGNGSNIVVSDAQNPFFQSASGGSIAYKDWSQAQINLSAYIGQTLTIVFMNIDCSLSGHYGYTYLDNLCTVCTTGCQYTLSINNSTTSTCDRGSICADYSLPQTGGNTGSLIIDLDIYQSGVKVGPTMSSPVLTSGTNYCFPINPAALGLNNSAGGFDYVLTGRFTINSFPLSPIIVGQIPEGQSPGTNNDYTIVCPCSVTAICKDATVTLVNGVASITAADVDNGSNAACQLQSIAVSPSTFNCSNIGPNNVVLTVTGTNGATATCNAIVNVVGSIPTCSITAIPANNTYTGGVPTNIYLGYGSQSVTLAAAGAGDGPFTYSWMPAAGLSNTAIANPVFTPTAAGIYTFVVTVTNRYGCSTTCSIRICVVDAREPGRDGKKILICHNGGNSLSVSINAVGTHLSHGDQLGTCGQLPCTPTAPVTRRSDLIEPAIKVVASPNPSNADFSLRFEDGDQSPVNIRILNAEGVVVLNQANVNPKAVLRLGQNFRRGKYVVEVTQKSKVSTFVIVKM